jgi:hypothetical protein
MRKAGVRVPFGGGLVEVMGRYSNQSDQGERLRSLLEIVSHRGLILRKLAPSGKSIDG